MRREDADKLTAEDSWWLHYRTAPVDWRAIVLGDLSLEAWRRQRIDCRPRWLQRLTTRGYLMQGRWANATRGR